MGICLISEVLVQSVSYDFSFRCVCSKQSSQNHVMVGAVSAAVVFFVKFVDQPLELNSLDFFELLLPELYFFLDTFMLFHELLLRLQLA